MERVTLDTIEWPLVHVRWPECVTHRSIDAFFDEVELLLDRRTPFAAIIDVDPIRHQTHEHRVHAASRIQAISSDAWRNVLGVANVADHWLGRATLTALFWLVPPPFPTRDFRHYDDARRWALGRLHGDHSVEQIGP
jgi:hypothetical protein